MEELHRSQTESDSRKSGSNSRSPSRLNSKSCHMTHSSSKKGSGSKHQSPTEELDHKLIKIQGFLDLNLD